MTMVFSEKNNFIPLIYSDEKIDNHDLLKETEASEN